jgi:hypothetical protein
MTHEFPGGAVGFLAPLAESGSHAVTICGAGIKVGAGTKRGDAVTRRFRGERMRHRRGRWGDGGFTSARVLVCGTVERRVSSPRMRRKRRAQRRRSRGVVMRSPRRGSCARRRWCPRAA